MVQRDCGCQQIGRHSEKYCCVSLEAYKEHPSWEKCRYHGDVVNVMEKGLKDVPYFLCMKRIPSMHESLGGISDELKEITTIVRDSVDAAEELLEKKVEEEKEEGH